MGMHKIELTTQTTEGQAQWVTNTLSATNCIRAMGMMGAILPELLETAGGVAKENPRAKDLLSINVGAETLGKLAGAIARGLAKPQVLELVLLLTGGMLKNGKACSFDVEFSGNTRILFFEIVPWLLRENFADFFDGSLGLPAMLEKMKDMIPGPATSTGGSGA